MVLKKVVRVAGYSAAAALAAMLVVIVLVVFRFQPIDPHSPGGIARLHILSQTAQPLIADLEHYHREHRCYPAQISDLYPDSGKRRRTMWYYSGGIIRQNAQQYNLSALTGPGHDPLLQFRRNADGTGQWTYNPGDGSPETPLSFSAKSE